MFGVACVGFTIVAVLLLLGWIRRNRAALPFGGTERAATRLVIGLGIATPLVLLTALFIWSDVFVIRTTAAPSPSSTRLEVHVVGHQWWWSLGYGGTPAAAHVGPDLTHVASRELLASGTIPNDRAHLRAWLQDPQNVKPGTKMPNLPLSPRDLDALVSYLESLK